MQTSYNEQNSAMPGMKADLSDSKVSSYTAQVRILFGLAVCLGADLEKEVAIPAAPTDITSLKAFRGVALKDHTIESKLDGLEPGVPANKPISVLEKGVVHALCTVDVIPSDDVYCYNTGADAGKFTNIADGGDASLVPNSRFRKNSIEVDGIKFVELELY